MAVDLGAIREYLPAGYGYVRRSLIRDANRQLNEVHFHIKVIKHKYPELAQRLDAGDWSDVEFWYDTIRTPKGVTVGEIWLTFEEVPSRLLSDVADQIESLWYDTERQCPDCLVRLTRKVLGRARCKELRNARTGLEKARQEETERKRAEEARQWAEHEASRKEADRRKAEEAEQQRKERARQLAHQRLQQDRLDREHQERERLQRVRLTVDSIAVLTRLFRGRTTSAPTSQRGGLQPAPVSASRVCISASNCKTEADPWVAKPGAPYRVPGHVEYVLDQAVLQPFQRNATAAWLREVIEQNDKYHRDVILENGRADFSESHKGISPEERVLLYCHKYMEMHLISNYHVLKIARRNNIDLTHSVLMADFGCGPLTGALAMAAHQHAFGGTMDVPTCQHIGYVGIDRAQAMLDKAADVARNMQFYRGRFQHALLSHTDPAPVNHWIKPHLDELPHTCRQKWLVINFSYLFASHSLNVPEMVSTVRNLIRQISDCRILMVHQNPSRADLNEKWQLFRGHFPEFRSVVSSTVTIDFQSVVGGKRPIRLRYELLTR